MSDRIMTEPCLDCGETGRFYQGHGRCRTCYMRWKRSTDPDYAARSRRVSVTWKAANRERTRQYDREHAHKPCPVCGAQMDRGSEMCAGCRAATTDVRRTLAEGMWADGWSLREMGEAFGVGPNYFTVARAQKGWDLPHRYKVRTAA